MWLKELSRRWLGRPTTGRPARPPATRQRGLRLTVEQLDERCLPSTLAVTSSSDDVTRHGTLRYAVAHAAGGDTIRLATGLRTTPIVLTQGELLLNQDVTVECLPHNSVTISGGGT